MVRRAARLRIVKRMLYVLLCLAVIFAQLLPLSTTPRVWAGPDLMFALTYAWAVRRPDYVPVAVLTALFLLSDVLFYRPLALWTLIMVVTVVLIKIRRETHDRPVLPVEFVNFTLTYIMVNLCYRFILGIFFVETAPIFLTLTQIVSTVAAYPVIVGLTHFAFGVRFPTPRDQDDIRRFA